MDEVSSLDMRLADIQMIGFLQSWISMDAATICTIKPQLWEFLERNAVKLPVQPIKLPIWTMWAFSRHFKCRYCKIFAINYLERLLIHHRMVLESIFNQK